MTDVDISSTPTFGGDRDGAPYGASRNSRVISNIGSHSLEGLLSFHERELEEEYIALWDHRGIDCALPDRRKS